MTTRRDELIDELLKDLKDPGEILGKDGLLKQLTKGLIERALEGELTDHLGYAKHEKQPERPATAGTVKAGRP